MKVKTSRFGDLEVDSKDLILFKEGILGFENLKSFFLVDPGDQTLILWLQSTENPTVAFPVLEPNIFLPEYSVSLLPVEMNSIAIQSMSETQVYVILTIPQVVTEMTANMKAPIFINNKTREARQIVLQDNKLEVKFAMYAALKKHIVKLVSDDSKRTRHTTAATETSTNTAQSSVRPVKRENSPEVN